MTTTDARTPPPEQLAPLAAFARAMGLELRPRWREGFAEPCCLAYQPAPPFTVETFFSSERTAESWAAVIRATRLALELRAAERGRDTGGANRDDDHD